MKSGRAVFGISRKRVRGVAWLSLVAMLFSAVSPAIAGVLLRDQPRALARMLGIPAAAVAAVDAAEHGHDHHGTPQHKSAPHTDHGIYCSLCLNASSTVAVAGSAAPQVLALAATDAPSAQSRPIFITAFHPFFRSRAPPALTLAS